MSRTIFSLILLLMVVVVEAQSKYDPVLSRDDYLIKSKKLKTTGTVLVTVGIAATVIGCVMAASADTGDDPMGLSGLNMLPGVMLITAGVTTALCSIHFYVKAGKYNRKAAALSFGNPKIISPFQSGFIATSQPTITLHIKF